jgi:hypothetical protein
VLSHLRQRISPGSGVENSILMDELDDADLVAGLLAL